MHVSLSFRSFKYKQQKAVHPAEDDIVKNDIYLQTAPLISQDMISLS